MINLLPPEDKRQIAAGRTNVLLLRYCTISLLLAIPLFAMVGVVYFMMSNARSAAETTISQSESRSAEYQQVQANAQAFNGNLSTAKTILDKEVRYAEIAVKIAQTLPPGIVLSSLSLDADSFGQPVTLTAMAHSYDDSIRLKNAFEQSPIFSDVYLQSVTQGGGESGGSYPVTISINVVINPEVAR